MKYRPVKWERALGAPEWMENTLDWTAQALAQVGELRAPEVWRGTHDGGGTWWAIFQPQPNGNHTLGLYVGWDAMLEDILPEVGMQFPGAWALNAIGLGGDMVGDVEARVCYQFSGRALPVRQLRVES